MQKRRDKLHIPNKDLRKDNDGGAKPNILFNGPLPMVASDPISDQEDPKLCACVCSSTQATDNRKVFPFVSFLFVFFPEVLLLSLSDDGVPILAAVCLLLFLLLLPMGLKFLPSLRSILLHPACVCVFVHHTLVNATHKELHLVIYNFTAFWAQLRSSSCSALGLVGYFIAFFFLCFLQQQFKVTADYG